MILKGFFLVILCARYTASLSCYTCKNVESLNNCDTTRRCNEGQSCYTIKQLLGGTESFTMGCRDNEKCGSIPVYDTVSKLSKDQPVEKCNECCGTNKCNNGLCDHKDPPPCVDKNQYCAYYNNLFDICNDTREASQSCRKFCKLCAMVDGKWADWSAWSACDVTCEHGKHTRTRTCTDPAPAYKGLDCEGKNINTKPCVRELCPVHGGWTDWSGWGACPVTCDSEHNTSVAFQAYYVDDNSPAKSSTVRFMEVQTNNGEAYNPKTGIFTAPRSGTYSFYAQLCVCSRIQMHFDIIVGSTTYASSYGYESNSNVCTSTQAVSNLNVNDKVYVKWQTYNYSYKNVILNSVGLRNSFSGTYLSP